LPGFELEVATRAEQDMADIGADIKDKVFTGEMLRLRYPGKYALAARAFFEKNRSAESICDILRISPQTMHALVETECAARGFSSVKARIRAKSASVALRTVSELQKLLDNPEAVRKAGIVGLTNALKALTGNEDGNQEGEKPKKSSSDDNSAADEFIDVYESADGFWREKNPARPAANQDAVDGGETDAGTDGSEGEEVPHDSPIESARRTEIKGFSCGIAKSADNPAAGSAAEPSGTAVASRMALEHAPHPGGGVPTPSRAGA
jgi:hypothetical protein